jgi:hypothetical protein
LVADEEIAATAKDKERKIVFAGEVYGFEELGFGGHLAEEAGRAADAKGGEGG